MGVAGVVIGYSMSAGFSMDGKLILPSSGKKVLHRSVNKQFLYMTHIWVIYFIYLVTSRQ